MPSQFITRPDGTVEHVRTGGKGVDPNTIKPTGDSGDSPLRLIPGADFAAAYAAGLAPAAQTLIKTGDVGKSIQTFYGEAAKDISRNASPVTRLAVAPVRNLAQNVLGNAPADTAGRLDPETMKAFPEPVRAALKGITGPATPRMPGAPDAKLLGVAPALPKIQYQNPMEEVLGGLIQGGMGFFLAAKGLKGAGGAAMRVPAVAGAAKAVQPAVQAARAAASFAKGAPGAAGVASRVALKTGSIAAQGALPGAIVDYAAFDPGKTLTDQVLTWVEKQRGTPLHAPLVDLVRSAPGDTAADARFKASIEGMLFLGPAIGGSIEGLGRVAKSIINLSKARQAAKATEPNIPPEPPASGRTVNVTAAPVGPNAKVATNPTAGPGVVQPAPKSKAGAPDLAKPYMDPRPVEVAREDQGRIDNPWADQRAAADDFARSIAATEDAVARASNPEPRIAVQPMGNVAAAAIEPPVTPSVPRAGIPAPAAAPTTPFQVEAYRGLKEGVDPTAPGLGGGRFFAPDEALAKQYAGPGGQVVKETLTFNNPLVVADKDAARNVLGLSPTSKEASVISVAKEQGYDGIVFENINQRAEYVDLRSPTAAAIEPPAAAFTDPLSAENLADARLTLGLPPTANLNAIQAAAKEQGYDAIQWTGTAGTPGGKGGVIDLREPGAKAPEVAPGPVGGEQPPAGPPPREPVEPGPGPENSDDWVRRFAQQLGATKEQLLSGELTYDDLLTNNFQKTQSPSGETIYTATKEDLVDGYNAMSRVLPDRAEMSGRPAFTREEYRSLNQAWLSRHGEDGPAIMRGLDPLIAGFEEYQLGALNRAMWLADKKQVEASMEAAMWLNSASVEGLNQSERLARLITAAESARATHEAVMRVTRPWGQLGAEMQVPRNYDAPPATGVAEQVVGAEAVDIEAAITRELEIEGTRPIEETITGKIDEELVDAANGGEITPKAQAAADALAQSLVSAGAEPAMRSRWWRGLDDPRMNEIGTNALLMLRTNNLISSGVTATTNLTNGLLNLARLPLQQAGGALAQGEMKRAMYSMMMFQQYWMNLSNAMRVAGHSLKAGRSLMNMDVSTLDWLDRVAQRDAQGELLTGPDAMTGWTINTVNMSQDMAQRPIGQVANRLWQILGTGASRLAIGIDTFNSTLAGYAYEHVRHLPRGMELAAERGMKEFSPESWKFAQQYADARTQETMKSAVIDGKNLADVAMESPQAENFMNAINFTDNVWTELETRTLSNGISIGQSRGLAGNDLQAFAQKYVEEGQMQHRIANYALNGPVAFGRLGSLPGEAMQTLSNARLVGPVFKFIQPFQRVPSNIIKSAMRNTPAAVFVDTWWRDITSEDAFTRDRAIGEVAVGSAALSLVAMASGLGSIRFNGGGPLDPAAKDKWTNIEKRMPYSVQVWNDAEGAWSTPTSMRALEPFATLFGAIGDYTDIANSLSTESRNRLGSSLVLTLARMSTSGVLSKSYFQGFNELYEAAFNPSKIITGPAQRDPLARYLSRIVASMVPYSSALRAARRETDTVSRTVDPSDIGGLMGFFQETLDEVRNAVPGWSNNLPARRDWINGAPILTQGVLGAEVIPAEMPWLQAAMQFTPFAAFQQGRETLGPVHEEMSLLSGKGTNFSGPRASDFGSEMRLTPSELEDYTLRFATVKDQYGLTFEQTATKLIESAQYQSWPVEGPSSRDVSLRAAAIQAEIQRFKKLAKEDFKFSTAKGQLIAGEEAAAEARKAEKTYIQRYGMDNSPQPAQPGAPWSPTPR
jgi:hypothetical protein